MSLSPSLISGGIAVVGLLLLVLTIVPTIIFIILVVANRAEPDPTGKRPMAAFLFGGSFLTLILLGLGSFGVVHGLTDLIGRHSDSFGFATVPSNDSVIRSVVMGFLLFVIAGVAHVLHRRRGLALADSESDAGSAVRRLARSYVAAVSFLSVVIFVLTLFVFANSILQLIAPGIFQAMGSRTDTVRTLVNEAYILIFTALAFRSHQNLAPAPLRLFAGRASTETPAE